EVVAVSSVYETAPVGGPDQGPYLNAVAVVETDLEPYELLDSLLRIEQRTGRERTVRWGPRTLDLDLILYGDRVLDDERLTVPHPRLAQRRFVLEPLAEVWPGAVLPDGRPVTGLLSGVQDQSVSRRQQRLEARPETFTSRGGWWVTAQGVVLVAAAVALVMDAGSPAWPAWVISLGAILVVAGVIQSLLGSRHLGANLTPYPQPLPSAKLVASGAYRWVRHPIYGGIVLLLVGAALLRSSLAALVVGIVGAAFFWMKARLEERRLMEHYPGYAAYRAHVRKRLIPWVV
ncbi:MAG TPA: 2-amino-4-hydroxy-6-hydroxymethyldihydropteridine diphosphokinase, partial [Actinobacteria bacterium]|nr:2-amino-4-hydroxy-6-hydroxymethyldihydropteridine diphosphokinase [Actinomycetota bacterium]